MNEIITTQNMGTMIGIMKEKNRKGTKIKIVGEGIVADMNNLRGIEAGLQKMNVHLIKGEEILEEHPEMIQANIMIRPREIKPSQWES